MPRIEIEEVFENWKKNPEYVEAYNSLSAEYALYEEMIKAQKTADITMKEIASRMETSESALSRMLSGKQTPSWKTISKFASALGKKPVISFVDNPL